MSGLRKQHEFSRLEFREKGKDDVVGATEQRRGVSVVCAPDGGGGGDG